MSMFDYGLWLGLLLLGVGEGEVVHIQIIMSVLVMVMVMVGVAVQDIFNHLATLGFLFLSSRSAFSSKMLR